MKITPAALFALAWAAALAGAGCGLQDRDVDARSMGPRKVPQFASTAGTGEPGENGGESGGEPEGGGPSGAGGPTTVGGGSASAAGGDEPARPEFDAGIEPDRNDVQAGELCERMATIQCAGEAACCINPGRDFAACKSELVPACANELLFDQISQQPSAGFDPARAKIVMEEFERLASTCDPSIAEFGESQAGLRSMFAGTHPPGESCRPSNLLSKPQAGAALASCTMSETTACLPSATTWTCVPRGGPGSPCFTDINCEPGLFCDNPKLDLAGSNCMARKPDGAPCSTGNECLSLFCIQRACVPADTQAAYCPE